jgi:hypothetical protein
MAATLLPETILLLPVRVAPLTPETPESIHNDKSVGVPKISFAVEPAKPRSELMSNSK